MIFILSLSSAIGSIKYVMLCTRPIVYLAMSLARGYDSDPGMDHWTAVKVILSYVRGGTDQEGYSQLCFEYEQEAPK